MKIKSLFTTLFIGLTLLLPLVTTSCKEELKMGQERIIEQSNKKQPKWVKFPPKQKRNKYFFVGEDTSFKNTDRYAYQVALSKASSFFNTKAQNTFTRLEESVGDYEANIIREEYIKNVSESSLRGAEHKDTYWEKVEKLTQDGVKYFYRVYVLVELDKKAIRATEEATLDMQHQNSENEATREALAKIKAELIKKYESEVYTEEE